MKNKLNITFLLLMFSLCLCRQTALAQQGGLDLTFGGGTGIYQDNLPTLPLPVDPVNIARYYGINEVLADGKIIVAGNAIGRTPQNSYFGDFIVRRLNPDGSVDTSFGSGGNVQTTFYRWGAGVGAQSDTGIGAMKVQPADGKIIVAGICRINGAPDPSDTALGNDLCLVRYNQNGTIDTSFGGNTVMAYGGNPNFPATTYTMAAGKVFTQTGTNVVNGATTGFGGTPVKIQIAPDGRIYVFGNSEDTVNNTLTGRRFKGFVAVYSTGGTLQGITSLFDTTGNTADGYGETRIYDGGILSNGDFIAIGSQRILVSSNPAVFSAVRWKVFTGSSGGGFLESDVNAGGIARSLTMLRSNKIMIGGQTGGVEQFGTPTLVRYNGDLTIDTTFGTNGRIVYDGTGNNMSIGARYPVSLKTQPDGKIIGSMYDGNIPRFNPNGSLDRSFARIREDVADNLNLRGVLTNVRYITPFPIQSGTDARINFGGINFRPNGKIVTSGSVGEGSIGGPSGRGVVTQLKTSFRNGGTFSDFNNDGKAELAVFRPSGGIWHSLDSFDNSYTPFQFGVGTDKLAPADYDGDGKTDRAIFRDGIWYIYQSSNNQVLIPQWGSAGDSPRPGDFNGDGFADMAVFRPSNGTWYILYSNPIQPGNIAYSIVQFGQNGDIPLIADFDGDGKSDVSVFRDGVWYYIRSTDGQTGIVQFGLTGDIPVVGDYDGDGKSDIAVFRPSNGVWYRLNSSDNSFQAVQFGITGDKPVPGDYDNDGKNDLAIYRSGTWWILRSSDNQASATQFGLSGDIPIPTAYLP